jgi:hypothetical protein
MRAVGYAVEPICAVLREQGVQVAARTYRAWKKRLPALRTIEDARVTDALRALKVPDTKGRPRPEIMSGRRKMTQWLRRNGFPEASKHTVDRLMREEGMNETRTTIPGKDGRRAGDLLNRDFTAPAPNRIWVTDFTYVPVYSGFVYVALVIDLYSPGGRRLGNLHRQGHRVRRTLPADGPVAARTHRPPGTGRTDSPQRCGKPVHLDPLHGHPGLGGPAAVHWQRG